MTRKHPRRKQEEAEAAMVENETLGETASTPPSDDEAMAPNDWRSGGAVAEVDPPGASSPPAALADERALEEQREKYLRLAAEYDNYRKRSLKERDDAEARG